MVLNRELGCHIKKTLPAIRCSLRNRMLELKKEIAKLEETTNPDKMKTSMMM
jgi:hypothetical protein